MKKFYENLPFQNGDRNGQLIRISYKADLILASDWLNLILALFFHIGRGFLILVEFSLYISGKLVIQSVKSDQFYVQK